MIHSFLPNKGEVRTLTPTITWFLWHWSLNLLKVLSVTVIFLTISWFLHMNPISLSFKCWSGHMRSKAKHSAKKGWVAVLQTWKAGGLWAPEDLPCESSFASFLFTLDSFGQHSCYKAFRIVFKKLLTAIIYFQSFFFFLIWKIFNKEKRKNAWTATVGFICFVLKCGAVLTVIIFIFRSFSFYFVSVQIKLTTWLSWFQGNNISVCW